MSGIKRPVLMGLALTGLVWTTGASNAEFREFTSAKGGKTIVAELVSTVGGGKVKIRREDGKELVVFAKAFSSSDQEFIQNWIKTSPQAVEYNFVIDIDEVKEESKKSEDNWERIHNEKIAYEVTITNRARSDVEGLTVKYKIYMEDRVSKTGYYNRDHDIVFHSGETKLPRIKFNQDANFKTKPHTAQRVWSKYSTLGGRSHEKDRMKGVWLRFYHGDEMVHEWRSDGVPVSDWDIKAKPKRSGPSSLPSRRPNTFDDEDEPPKKVNPFKA